MKKPTLLIALISLCSLARTSCMNQESNRDDNSNHYHLKRKRSNDDDQNNKQKKYSKHTNDNKSLDCKKINNPSLHRALFAGIIDSAKNLLDKNPNLAFETNSKGQTPLHLICLTKNLSYQESADLIKYFSKTFKNNEKLLTRLLNTQDDEGATPLHVAATEGNYRAIKALLKYGANTTIKKADRETENTTITVLHQTVLTKHAHNSDRILTKLLKNKNCLEMINDELENGTTALGIAVSQGDLKSVKVLLAHGADTKIKSSEKNKLSRSLTLLHRAIMTKKSHNADLILRELLKDNDCRNMINDTLDNGDTPLMRAISLGNFECVKILLNHSADVTINANEMNSRSRTQTVLHAAIISQNRKDADLILKELLKDEECRKMINVRLITTGMTALDLAILKNDYVCVQILQQNGANPQLNTSKTALSLNTDKGIITLIEQNMNTNQYQINQENASTKELDTPKKINITNEIDDNEMEIQVPNTSRNDDEHNIDANSYIQDLNLNEGQQSPIIEDEEYESRSEENDEQNNDEDNNQWIIIKDLSTNNGSESPIIEEEEEDGNKSPIIEGDEQPENNNNNITLSPTSTVVNTILLNVTESIERVTKMLNEKKAKQRSTIQLTEYYCSICSLDLKNKNAFNLHMKSHNNKN